MIRLVLLGILRFYRAVISPLYAPRCRYYPSCSSYALGAVDKHGAVRGSYLAVARVCSCHPWALGGYDPVPDKFSLRPDHPRGSTPISQGV